MKSERIRRFLADRFLFDEHAAIDVDQSLIESGVLDSTGAMELVLFLETEFSIEVLPHELVPQNLDSIARITSFVIDKVSEKGAGPCAEQSHSTSAQSASSGSVDVSSR